MHRRSFLQTLATTSAGMMIGCGSGKIPEARPLELPEAKQSTAPVQKIERLSDKYSHDLVRSYECYEAAIPGHVLTLFNLRNGLRFPMLCCLEDDAILPLYQSVFNEEEPDSWSIMVEPEIKEGFALMQLEISEKGGVVSMRDSILRKITHLPKLLKR